jgi:hypothetical protein
MICVTVEIREGAITRRAQFTTSSIERALELAGGGKPGRRVRLIFPIDSEAFFVPGNPTYVRNQRLLGEPTDLEKDEQ